MDENTHTGLLAFALMLLAALAAAWVYMVSDEERFAKLEQGADAVLDRIFPA